MAEHLKYMVLDRNQAIRVTHYRRTSGFYGNESTAVDRLLPDGWSFYPELDSILATRAYAAR